MSITARHFYTDWQFYTYIACVLGLLIVSGLLGQKFLGWVARAGNLVDTDGELQSFVRNQLIQFFSLFSFLILIWVASNEFYFAYLLYIVSIGIGLVVVRRAILTVIGLKTQDMKLRLDVMLKLGMSPVGAGISVVLAVLGSLLLIFLLCKVIMLRYSAVPADQARLEMLLWVFGGQSLFGVFVAFPTFALTMLRPALDPYVRVQLFLDSLFAIGSLVIALCLPYLLFDSSIRGAVRLLPGDIDSIYWLIGVLCALFTVFFMIGDFAYNAQRKELLKKSDRWLHELETAQLLDVKSDFRRERSINARLEAPRMIAELISDDVYLAGFWVWRYEKARQGLEAFADRVIAAKPLDITDGSAEPLDDEVREQKSNQIAIADQRPNGSLTWWRTLIPGGKIRSAERPIEITERFRLEVKRSMGFLFGGKSLIYTGVAQTFGKLFSDNQMALARWNPRLLFLIGYTELMFVPEQRERVLEIIEDLKTNIVFLRSEPNRALRGALTLSFSSSALLTSIVELVKILALKWS